MCGCPDGERHVPEEQAPFLTAAGPAGSPDYHIVILLGRRYLRTRIAAGVEVVIVKRPGIGRLLLALSGAALFAGAGNLSAQEAGGDPGAVQKTARIDEVVVTTRKREENLQTVPLPVTALSGQELEDRGIESLADLANHTAGLEFASTGNVGGSRPVIRGLSQQTRVGDETNVATFVDGVYSPGFSGATLSFDALERVEVVRGPQSASYGRNSFAGAINYISRKPTTEVDYGARGTLGTDEMSALSTYVNGPVFGESLAGRLDLGYRNTGGTLKNALDAERLSSQENEYIRAAARWSNERFVIDTSVSFSHDDYSPAARTTIDPDDPRRVGKAGGGGNPFEIGAVFYEVGPEANPRRFGRRLQGEIRDLDAAFFIDTRAGGERDSVFSTLSLQANLGDYSLQSIAGYQQRQVQLGLKVSF